MRVLAALSCLVVLGLAAGCAVGENEELRALVEEAELGDDSSVGCEWGSSSYESEPESWYGCWNYVPGTLDDVAETFRARLAAKGFDVRSRDGVLSVQMTAVRGGETLCVDVLDRGFEAGRNTYPAEVDISPGEVFVDVWAAEPRQAAGASGVAECAELPAFPEE